MAPSGNAPPDDRSWLVVVAAPVSARGHNAARGGTVPYELGESWL